MIGDENGNKGVNMTLNSNDTPLFKLNIYTILEYLNIITL